MGHRAAVPSEWLADAVAADTSGKGIRRSREPLSLP